MDKIISLSCFVFDRLQDYDMILHVWPYERFCEVTGISPSLNNA